MRMLCLACVAALTACGNRPGTATAAWVGGGVDERVEGEALAGWCVEARSIVLEVSAEDRAAGVSWHCDSLAPGVALIAPPAEPDTQVPAAAVAARYVHLAEVRGYRGLAGTLRVRAVDSTTISATVEATVQQIGEDDTLRFTAAFHQIPLSRDETLCTR